MHKRSCFSKPFGSELVKQLSVVLSIYLFYRRKSQITICKAFRLIYRFILYSVIVVHLSQIKLWIYKQCLHYYIIFILYSLLYLPRLIRLKCGVYTRILSKWLWLAVFFCLLSPLGDRSLNLSFLLTCSTSGLREALALLVSCLSSGGVAFKFKP